MPSTHNRHEFRLNDPELQVPDLISILNGDSSLDQIKGVQIEMARESKGKNSNDLPLHSYIALSEETAIQLRERLNELKIPYQEIN